MFGNPFGYFLYHNSLLLLFLGKRNNFEYREELDEAEMVLPPSWSWNFLAEIDIKEDNDLLRVVTSITKEKCNV